MFTIFVAVLWPVIVKAAKEVSLQHFSYMQMFVVKLLEEEKILVAEIE